MESEREREIEEWEKKKEKREREQTLGFLLKRMSSSWRFLTLFLALQVTTTPSPPPPPPESPEIFSCDLCDKKTKNQNLLNLHLIAMHYKKEILASYGNPEHQCKVCRKLLPNADAFAFHIGQDHNKLAEFVKKKPAAVKAKVTNGDVVNGDSGGGQLACFKCGSVGKDKAALYGHYSLHHFSQVNHCLLETLKPS